MLSLALSSAVLSTKVRSSSIALLHVSHSLTDSSANIDADVAYQCLQSVPLVVEDAVDLLDGWAAFLEWQSDPTWKADPPSDTYLFPAFDYMQAVADLRDRVTSGSITAELDLHEGIRDIIYSSNDGHMFFRTDFNSVFFWQRAVGLVSVSPDGHSLPEVFASSDVSLFLSDGLTYTPSPIISIDGQEPAEFLSSDYTKANILQDPDALVATLPDRPMSVN